MYIEDIALLFVFQHGADPNKKNRDGHTPLDLVKEGDTDVADLLRGESVFYVDLFHPLHRLLIGTVLVTMLVKDMYPPCA